MSHLLTFANGNAYAPVRIHGIRRLDATRFVTLNEFGKLIDVDEVKEGSAEEAAAVSKARQLAVQDVVNAGRRWTQPDWDAIREKALADLAAARQPKGPKNAPAA